MNKKRNRRKKSAPLLFFLIFLVSFAAAMPFMVKAVWNRDHVKETPDQVIIEKPEEQETEPEQIEEPVKEQTPEDSQPQPEDGSEQNDSASQEPPEEDTGEQEQPGASGGAQTDNGTETQGQPQPEGEKDPADQVSGDEDFSCFDNALFIGDSRTVGISEYSGITNADFFATTGMSVYEVMKETVSVPSVGKVTLEQLLGSVTYNKVFLMLGINELGYDFNSTVEKYGQVVDFIREAQPQAVIYIQANLHVTKSRSDSDSIFNNQNIDRFNTAISALANGEDIFYIDVNELFDDDTGSLDQNYTSDNAHVLGKYYKTWAQWLAGQVSGM